MRKRYPGSFKFKIAIEALKGERTISDICREYNLSPDLVHNWKNHLKQHGVEVFELASTSTRVPYSAFWSHDESERPAARAPSKPSKDRSCLGWLKCLWPGNWCDQGAAPNSVSSLSH